MKEEEEIIYCTKKQCVMVCFLYEMKWRRNERRRNVKNGIEENYWREEVKYLMVVANVW